MRGALSPARRSLLNRPGARESWTQIAYVNAPVVARQREEPAINLVQEADGQADLFPSDQPASPPLGSRHLGIDRGRERGEERGDSDLNGRGVRTGIGFSDKCFRNVAALC